MKRVLYIATILFCASFAMSCSKDMPDTVPGSDSNEGVAALRFNLPETRAEYDLMEYCDVRFYKYNDASKESKSLIRHYYEFDEVPESIWLLEGDYCVTISLGDRESGTQATFDRPIYFGSTDFGIVAGQTVDVTVDCRIQNTIVKVVFDPSVIELCDREGTDDILGLTYKYRATIAVRDSWSTSAVTGNTVPNLHYLNSDAKADKDGNVSLCGYFVLPEGAEKISYCFHGFSSNETLVGHDPNNSNKDVRQEIHTHGNGKVLSLPAGADSREGVMYTMKFKYSSDAPGHIGVEFTISIADPDEIYDIAGVDPSPKPQIDGNGWTVGSEAHAVEGEQLSYKISYEMSALDKVDIYVDDAVDPIEVDLSSSATAGADGISVDVQRDGHEAVLTFGQAFFNNLTGGQHTLEFHIDAANEKSAEAKSVIKTQGMMAVEQNAWAGVTAAEAMIFAGSASQAKIQYSEKGSGAWSDHTPVATPSGDIYAESVSGFGAEKRDKTFEYRLMINGVQYGKSIELTTASAPQIPNAGFETWTKPSSALLPYGNGVDQWWDTGNHGSTTLGSSWNITTNETDNIHEGSTGTTYAKLSSKWVIMKFAAGNIFLGQYAGTNGTNGVIAFGKPFSYTYRPKALRFWYKATIDKINRGSGAPGVSTNDLDPNEIYIVLGNMGGPHIVNTADKSTFVDLSQPTIPYCTAGSYSARSTNDKDDGKIIAKAVWNNTESQGEWIMKEVELEYNEDYDGEMPNFLMLTASASKYGDYFMGCDSNVLCLDDVELVY